MYPVIFQTALGEAILYMCVQCTIHHKQDLGQPWYIGSYLPKCCTYMHTDLTFIKNHSSLLESRRSKFTLHKVRILSLFSFFYYFF